MHADFISTPLFINVLIILHVERIWFIYTVIIPALRKLQLQINNTLLISIIYLIPE